jgi:hypothetical protein
MIILPVTLTIAGAAALLNIWLGFRINQLRIRHKIFIGHGGNEALEARMRAHANFTEYTPFFLILLGLIELAKGMHMWLWIVGIVFIIGRIAHAFGMDQGKANAMRAVGTLATWLGLLMLAFYALAIPYLEHNRGPDISYAVVDTAQARART